MGYRSEVAIAVRDSTYENLKKHDTLLNWAEITQSEDGVLLYWSDIKWYGDLVDAFMIDLNNLSEEDYYKIELGEEESDNQRDGFWIDNPFDLGISRSIYKNV
jgi:hypothetical protein